MRSKSKNCEPKNYYSNLLNFFSPFCYFEPDMIILLNAIWVLIHWEHESYMSFHPCVRGLCHCSWTSLNSKLCLVITSWLSPVIRITLQCSCTSAVCGSRHPLAGYLVLNHVPWKKTTPGFFTYYETLLIRNNTRLGICLFKILP